MKVAILVGFFVASVLTSQQNVTHAEDCKYISFATLAASRYRPIVQIKTDRRYAYKLCLHVMLLLLSGDVETNPGPEFDLAEPESQSQIQSACQRCTQKNNRKRKIQCKNCNTWWHLSCVRLTRSQAATLARWWCPDCMADDGPSDHLPETSQPSARTRLLDETAIAETLAKLKRHCKVIPRIPKGARIPAAEALTKLIETALTKKSAAAWSQLLRFPFSALSVPPRVSSISEVSFTTKVKRQISDYMTEGAVHYEERPNAARRREPCAVRSSTRTQQQQAGEALRKRVGAKLSDGDVKGALRLLTSGDEMVPPTAENVAILESKHPTAPADEDLPPCPDEQVEQPAEAAQSDVTAAIGTFNSGSSAGLDGLRPAHLKDLTSRSAGEAGARLVTALTALVNTALMGHLPDCARDAFYAASLTALRKRDGGLRPIAIGSVYRRLATKVALKPLTQELGSQLRPVQLGYGTVGGCEAAVHAARHFFENMTKNEVLVKIDMRNAFNAVRRDKLLSTVRQRAPSLYRLLWQAYSTPSSLFFGSVRIESATGLQQGDPCGPAVFSLVVDAAAKETTSAFNIWYLDDAAIGGNVESVCRDLE